MVSKTDEKSKSLNLVTELERENIIDHFVANKLTQCLEIKLNNVYSNKVIISGIYSDWIKTVGIFIIRVANKGITQNHINLIIDTLDSNYEEILKFIYGEEEDRVLSSALQLVDENIVEVFLDDTKTMYAAIYVNSHVETISLESKQFQDWVGGIYYHHTKGSDYGPRILSDDYIGKIQSVIRYEAGSTNQSKQLHLRVAAFVDSDTANSDENVIHYDLCNTGWEIIKVTRYGWDTTKSNECNILFKRFPIMNAQVYPRKDYPHDILEQFMKLTNVYDDEDNRLLAIVYIISLFLLEDVPKPMLNPNGPHGSGKSTYQEFVKRIVDPSAALTTAFPNNLPELVQILSHSYVTFFDNVSEISQLTSDQLCRAVTGSGFVKRRLYENDQDFIYSMKRAVGYNGILISAHRADLLDRLLNLKLKMIDKRKRKKLKLLHKEFEAILPYLLGYIFDILSQVLNRIGEVKLDELPRMADFAEMGELISRCIGYPAGQFTEAYKRNIGQTNEEAINSNLVASAIILLMNKQKICSGKAGELLSLFNDLGSKNQEFQNLISNRWWPKTPKAFSNRITEIEPNLKDVGIIVERVEDKHSKSTRFMITNLNYSSGAFEENGGG